MKRFIYVATFAMAIGFTSCGTEDVIDFACDTARETLKETVQNAIETYTENSSTVTCEAVRTAINEYKDSPCGNTLFDTILADLPDCSTVDN